jgi:hypothetical protein
VTHSHNNDIFASKNLVVEKPWIPEPGLGILSYFTDKEKLRSAIQPQIFYIFQGTSRQNTRRNSPSIMALKLMLREIRL